MTVENISGKPSNMNRAWPVAIMVVLCGICMPFNMGKAMVLGPVIMQVYGIGEAMLGLMIAAFYLLGAVVAFPAASFIKKIGPRNTILVALGCSIVGNLIGILVPGNTPAFIVGRIIEGGGFGLMGVAGVPTISPWFSKDKRGMPCGLWAAWVAIALAIAPILFTAIFETTGELMSVWYFNFGFSIVVLVLFLLIYRTPSDPYIDEEEKAGDTKMDYKAIFTNKAVLALAVTFFFGEGAFMGVLGFFNAYVANEVSMPLMVGSVLISVAGFAGAIWGPVAGKISDAIGSRFKVLVVCQFCMLAYSVIVFSVHTLTGLIIAVVLQVLTTGITAMLWTATTEVVPSKLIPGATAALAFAQNVGQCIGSMGMGSVIQALGYQMASWCVVVPCWILSIVVTWVVLRKKLR